jgi:Fe-S oxidoreductase
MRDAAAVPTPPWGPGHDVVPEPDRLIGLAEEFLSRCRGEGPANCTARCPLDVDARGYVQLTAEGMFREALQLVRQRLPFPGILGYLCTHPCELHCKRIDEDEAVRIREIKHFLAEWEPGDPRHVLDREPARKERVAVIGAGPAGLIAAHDLTRLGYDVTVFEKERVIGGCLAGKIPEWRLPRWVVDRDLSIVEALGIRVRFGFEIGGNEPLQGIRDSHDAVLLTVGYDGGSALLEGRGEGLRRNVRDALWADPRTCETGVTGVFAAGDAVSGPSSVIDALAFGRRAAESADRYLTGADLRVDRVPPLPRRLLWSLDVDETERRRRERKPVMFGPHGPSLSENDARREAERCLACECGLCVDDCDFLAKHCGSPRELARRVTGELERSLPMVFSCTVCGLCAEVCPEALDTGRLLHEARREAGRRGIAPLPQHATTMRYLRSVTSGRTSLVMPEPGRSRSRWLFFPGCFLPETSPSNTLELYDLVRRQHRGTGVMLHCCGAPAEMLGMEEAAAAARDAIRRMADSVGAEEIIPACPDCVRVLRETLPGLKVTPVWELLAERWDPLPYRKGSRVCVHDACRTRRDSGLQASVRHLVASVGGAMEEVRYSGNLTRCCGLGGALPSVDPDLADRISARRAAESDLPMLTYCAGCRIALSRVGRPAVHMVDFLFSSDWEEVARRKAPGPLVRWLNRLRARRALRRIRPLEGS